MVETFSSSYKLEKGALGLFFEMNVATGIFLFGYTFLLHNYMEMPEGLTAEPEL